MPKKKQSEPLDNVKGQKKPILEPPPSRDMPVTYETVRNPAIIKEIQEYATNGLTLEQISRRLRVTTCTLYSWSKKYPEVRDAILEGKRVADDRVEYSLYEMCFAHDEKEIVVEKDENGNITKQIIRTKHIPANVTAIQWWLQNRRKDTWQNRQHVDLAGNSAVPVQIVYDLQTKSKPSTDEPKKE